MNIFPIWVGFIEAQSKDMGHLNTSVITVMKLFTNTRKKLQNNKQIIRPAIKSHGGKWYLKDFIIENFPQNYQELNYCEIMCAGASVFLNKELSPIEIINDLDKGVVSIFKALRDEPKEFITKIKKIKYSEKSFQNALKKSQETFIDYIDQAINEYILRRMSRGGMKKAFAWSDRMRGGQPGDINAWKTSIKQLPLIANRVKNAIILNKDFIEIFKNWDEENTFFYIDPPYLPSTRVEGSTQIYDYEMTEDQHVDLLYLIKNCRGKVLLSGYPSILYNRSLKGWKIKKKNIANHSSQSKTKERRIECLWMNY